MRRVSVLAFLVSAATITSGLARLAAQQPVAPAPAGEQMPRFLLASADRRPPVVVDAHAVPILRHRISITLADVSLGEALRTIAAEGGIQLNYSRDILPLQSRVRLKADDITVAAALTEVLLDAAAGVDVLIGPNRQVALVRRVAMSGPAPVGSVEGRVADAKTAAPLVGATVVIERTSLSAATGNDGRYRIAAVVPGTYTVTARYIGYAPAVATVTVGDAQTATADFSLEKSAQRLDEVVTTGTIVPTEIKALPTPITVITAEDIQRQNVQRVDQLFRGQVPGLLANDLGAYDYSSTVTARGTSTFGFPSMKTYVDGIEIAVSNYLNLIDPNTIERVEITRGPQASTLYGAEALNGVIQIFTKKGAFGQRHPELSGKLSAGGIGGVRGSKTSLRTDNSLSVLGGGDRASYNLTGTLRHTGEWMPEYGSMDWGLSAGTTVTQGAFTLGATAQYAAHDFDYPHNPVLPYPQFTRPENQRWLQRQQTYGATLSYQATRAWRHSVTLGYAATSNNYFNTRPRLLTPDDTLLTVVLVSDSRLSLLYHSDLRLPVTRTVSATATAGVDYTSGLHGFSYTDGTPVNQGFSLGGTTFVGRVPATDVGYFGQAQVSVDERLFLTAGLRAEQNDDFGASVKAAWSPRVGASYVLPLAGAEVKLRGSYGESIRPPTFGLREASVTTFNGVQLANPELRPERQRGWDGGLEVYAGRRSSLGITYYNQRAVDLIQGVTIMQGPTTPATQYQNVGEIKNEGWELEGRVGVGRLDITGTYTIMRSTVKALAPGYTGDNQVGDRLNNVPYATAGASVTYAAASGTTLTASLVHIGHLTGTDWLALYGVYYGGQPYRGSNRAYWIEYPTATKVAVSVSQQVTPALAAFARAENVGNNLRAEGGDNTTPPTPRNVTVGITFRY